MRLPKNGYFRRTKTTQVHAVMIFQVQRKDQKTAFSTKYLDKPFSIQSIDIS